MDFNKTRYITMSRRRRSYEGKAKVLYEGPEPGTLIQHFKDDATAFNAKKHQVIEGKGVLNNRISEYLFQHLNDIGVPTHFIRRLNMREQLIREVEIVPLEVVVRNVAGGVGKPAVRARWGAMSMRVTRPGRAVCLACAAQGSRPAGMGGSRGSRVSERSCGRSVPGRPASSGRGEAGGGAGGRSAGASRPRRARAPAVRVARDRFGAGALWRTASYAYSVSVAPAGAAGWFGASKTRGMTRRSRECRKMRVYWSTWPKSMMEFVVKW